MSNEAPLTEVLQARVPAAAAGADATSPVAVAPFDGTITAVTYTPDATITGAVTNSRTITVVNETQSVTAATLALVNAVNAPADAAKAIPVSGTPANVAVAQGDVIAFVSTHVGTGIADPGGLVEVTFARS